MAQALKRRSRAYGLLAAFPLGLHRSYLDEPRGAWAYRLASLAAALVAIVDWRLAAGIALLVLAGVVYDAFWIERRLVALNKVIRRRVYLSQTAGPPEGFRGRYSGEDDAAAPARAPSFAEQERLLRALGKRPGDSGGPEDPGESGRT